MFEGWDSFFLLVGGAAGAMIGLLFVVASLPSGLERQNRLRGTSLYMSPLVFHLAVVVVISGAALAPRLTPQAIASVVGLCALTGLIHLGVVTWALGAGKGPVPHWSDIWCYGVAPLVAYAAMAAVAVATASGLAWAAEAVGVAVLILLLIAVRNAWDLVTWLAPGGPGAQETPPQA
jgi:hypothetical protein